MIIRASWSQGISLATPTGGEVSALPAVIYDESRRYHRRPRRLGVESVERPSGSPLAGVGAIRLRRRQSSLVLVALGVANVAMRARWHEVEDGVLWAARVEGVTAVEVLPESAGEAAGIQAGRRAVAVNGAPVRIAGGRRRASAPGHEGTRLAYTLLRLGIAARRSRSRSRRRRAAARCISCSPPSGSSRCWSARRCALRRPRDQATLHFFWLCVAFFGAFTFSFNGPFDRLDWVFYWGDAVAHGAAAAAAAALHAGVSRAAAVGARRPRPTGAGLPLLYLPALVLGRGARRRDRAARRRTGRCSRARSRLLDRARAGLPVRLRRRGARRAGAGVPRDHVADRRGGSCAGSRGARRSASARSRSATRCRGRSASIRRWRCSSPPFRSASCRWPSRRRSSATGCGTSKSSSSAAWPTPRSSAPASRSTSRCASWSASCSPNDADPHNWIVALLATTVVVLLAQPVKEAVQNALDRVFYRDRYDYRRALVGVRARSEQRPRRRPPQPAAGRAHRRDAGRRSDGADARRRAARATSGRSATSGFAQPVPRLSRDVVVHGAARCRPHRRARRSDRGRAVRGRGSRVLARCQGIYYFVPCVFEGVAIAVLALGRKETDEPFNSEDLALLTAVAGQVATAIENGRLYRQLHLKAEELGRMREFNENILESLDDGLVVFDADERIVRWNQRARELLRRDARRRDRPRRSTTSSTRRSSRRCARRAAENPHGATLFRVPLTGRERHGRRAPRLLVNATAVPLQSAGGARGVGRDASCSSRTSPIACASRSSCRFPRRWRRSACWRPASRTRSTRR